MQTLILATGNRHKVEEFSQILAPCGWHIRALGDVLPGFPEPEETAPDFVGNARLKALAARSLLPSDSIVVADDSGLEVASLGGEPGVYSARFAQRAGTGSGDADNRTELVRRLRATGLTEPNFAPAAFVCALSFLAPHREVQALGRCEGAVGLREQGDQGFGYDSLFHPQLADGSLSPLTFAQMTALDKHALSHRGKALEQLARRLSQG